LLELLDVDLPRPTVEQAAEPENQPNEEEPLPKSMKLDLHFDVSLTFIFF